MGETAWTHFGIVAVPTLMILGFWIDSRTRAVSTAQKRDDEHRENTTRLARIETKLDPIWKWWNNQNGRHDDE